MRNSVLLSAAVVAVGLSIAPLVNAETPEQTQQQAQQAQADAGHGKTAAMNPDHRFMKEASMDNQFEIQLAQWVEQKAENSDVKQLAQQMVQDHQQAQQQLEEIAKGMKMRLPSQLEQWQQDKLQAMQQMHGKHMEMHFAFGQVGDHTTDILTYQYAAEHAQNEQLKQYAEQTIPVLEKHLKLAEEASAQWVPQARTASEKIKGAAQNAVKDAENGHTGQNTGINR